MIKAVAGGGGRGMRVVDDADELAEAYARCQSEAQAAFGKTTSMSSADPRARHIEVQIVGDGHGASPSLRARMHDAAPPPEAGRDRAEPVARRRLARAASSTRRCGSPTAARYDSLGTFEFLVDGDAADAPASPSSRPTRACRSSTP